MGITDRETQGKRSVRHEADERGIAVPADPSNLLSTTTAAAIDALTAIGGYLEASRQLLEHGGESWRDILRITIDKAHAQTMRAGDLVRKMGDTVRKND